MPLAFLAFAGPLRAQPLFVAAKLPGDPGEIATRGEIGSAVAETFRLPLGELRPFYAHAEVREDVPPGHWAEPAVRRAQASYRQNGFPDMTRNEDYPMTRHEFAGILSRVLLSVGARIPGHTWPDAPLKPEPFADLPPDHWWNATYENLRRWGVIEGYPDQTFKGKRYVTRGETQTCLERAAALFGPRCERRMRIPEPIPGGDRTRSSARGRH